MPHRENQKMGDCHLSFSYNSPNTEEKLCKYSYSSWCSTCERLSPRRRSKSESNEFCRKKCKEMKTTASPRKYTKSQEYENMDLDMMWYDNTKDYKHETTTTTNRDTRIRSNLCELPTSYISNNCQITNNITKLSNDRSDLVDCLEKSVKTYEQTLKFVDYNEMIEKQKVKHKINSNINKMQQQQQQQQESIKKNNHNINKQNNSIIKSSNDIDLMFHDYDTCTYFDKITETNNLQERYAKEVQVLREKLKTMRNHPTTTTTNNRNENNLIKTHKNTITIEKKFNNKTLLLPSLIKVKSKVSLKTRNKLGSVSNLKRIKGKTNTCLLLTASNHIIESDYSGSDDDDDDDDNNDDNANENLNETPSIITTNLDTILSSSTTVSSVSCNSGNRGDNISGWPIRLSLFPNIPPYIHFISHDSEMPIKLPAGRKFFKWKLSTITPILVRRTLTNSGFALVRSEFSRDSNQWLGTWGKHMKSPLFQTLKDTQKLNHFPGTFQLGRKDRLWRNFQRLINKHGYKEFGFIPQSFILPQELKLLKQNWEYKNGDDRQMWIIKPPASARGVGIRVINKWSQLPKKMSLVVQKYISNPYLINGSKFDLRLYVLVTSFNPLRIYLYPDGLARFASAKYSDDVKDLKDRYMHLTNYSINKLSSHYTANEDANACQGHKWTLLKLLEYMEKQGIDTKLLWKNLQQLVIKTMITGESPIYQLCDEHMNSRYNCYELFGVDVLLDEKLKPWLLEVNISPSLHSTSPLDAYVKGPMVHMLFDMAQFHFPIRLSQTVPQSPQPYESKLYSINLTKKERQKHSSFIQFEKRCDYLEDILKNLTGDDVRRLTQAEDEFTVKGRFERIFPTSQTYKYLDFLEIRYYNRLFDAWETKYENNRETGINILRNLCAQKKHLKVAPPSVINKNLPNTTPVVLNLQPSKDSQQNNPSKEETITNNFISNCK